MRVYPYLSCNDHLDRGFFQDIFNYYFLEILLSDLELVFLEFKHFYKTHRTILFSFYLLILYSLFLNPSVMLSTFCTFPITSVTKENNRSFKLTSNTTATNTVISPNSLVWKFCVKAQFPWNVIHYARNHPEIGAFTQNFHTRKLGEITVFFAVYIVTSNRFGLQCTVKYNKYLSVNNLFACKLTSENNIKEYLVSYFYKQCFFKGSFYKRTCTLCRSSYIFD